MNKNKGGNRPVVKSGLGYEPVREMSEIELAEFTTKLNGVILRQAELQNNFEGVYLNVFKRMVEFETFGGNDILEVLGDVGG